MSQTASKASVVSIRTVALTDDVPVGSVVVTVDVIVAKCTSRSRGDCRDLGAIGLRVSRRLTWPWRALDVRAGL